MDTRNQRLSRYRYRNQLHQRHHNPSLPPLASLQRGQAPGFLSRLLSLLRRRLRLHSRQSNQNRRQWQNDLQRIQRRPPLW